MNDNGQKKPSSRAGCVVGIVTVLLMLIGLLLIVWSGKAGENAPFFVAAGVAVFLFPLLGTLLMTLIPQKARGVKAVPKKERVRQILLVVSVIMVVGGFIGALAAAFFEKTPLIIALGVTAGVGFLGAIIISSIHTKETGENGINIELFPTDPEQEKQDMETAREILGEVIKKQERLSDEERERELQRIEQQDRLTGNGMTREQVEEYENNKRGGGVR